jgi:hypothetical protein
MQTKLHELKFDPRDNFNKYDHQRRQDRGKKRPPSHEGENKGDAESNRNRECKKSRIVLPVLDNAKVVQQRSVDQDCKRPTDLPCSLSRQFHNGRHCTADR